MHHSWTLLQYSASYSIHHRDQTFNNGPSKICGRQSLKTLKEYGLLEANHTSSKCLKVVFHRVYLVHSWILCPICCSIFSIYIYSNCWFINWSNNLSIFHLARQIVNILTIGDNSFVTFAKVSEKLTFLTPDTHTFVCIRA